MTLTQNLSRRHLLIASVGSLLTPMLTACSGRDLFGDEPKPQVNAKVLWARRQEWSGKEWVRGVVSMGDRYLMVRGQDHLGWVFPGGPVDEERHGEPVENTKDLINAVTEYVHDQATIQVWAKQSTEIAYGYGIDKQLNELLMIHWLQVNIPSNTLPIVHPNLETTEEVRWVALDDPELGPCLQQRLNEMADAMTPLKESGGTVILDFCDA